MAFFVLAADRQLARIPVDPVPPQAFSSELVPVDLDPDAPPGWILSGAWQLRGHDIAFRGLSGLAFDGDALVAVSDNGLMVRFFPFGCEGPSEAAVRMIDPDSPYQDAEALAVRGGAAFVAYEGTPILLRQGGQPAQRFALPGFARGNRGAEALFDTGSELFAIGEDGRQAAVFRDGRLAPRGIRGSVDAPTGAARWPGRRDGLLLQRGFGIGGFRASVSTLSITPGGDLVAGRPAYPLGLSWTDNAEGIAIRERTGGGHEVWIVTDDNARPPQRSLLVRYDVPEGGWPFGDAGVNRPVAPSSD
ncbi:esterase-like activity of phytase family protein [Sphingomicrobium sp. XHP0239]|uniref:esterase-like activity of phytase family protein n=1 Tax=Sphingomicrobium maritimum TaxID=3133972 RepID=UPI0031CC9739